MAPQGTGIGNNWVPPPHNPNAVQWAKFYAILGPDTPRPLGGVWLATWGKLRSFDSRVFGKAVKTAEDGKAYLESHGHLDLANRPVRRAY